MACKHPPSVLRAGGAAAQAVAALEFDARGPDAAELVAALARMLARAHGDARAVRARFAAVRQAAALAADAAAARQDALRELASNARARALPRSAVRLGARPAHGCCPAGLRAASRRPMRGRSPG